jgi:predicted acetyltransferase
MSAITRLIAISDCVTLLALRDGADLKGIRVSSHLKLYFQSIMMWRIFDDKWINRIHGRLDRGRRRRRWQPGLRIGFELASAHWGHGLATEGAREAIRFGWARTPLTRIISATAAGHLASRRVMEKCGLAFQAEITFRGAEVAWHAIDRPERGLPAGPSLGP